MTYMVPPNHWGYMWGREAAETGVRWDGPAGTEFKHRALDADARKWGEWPPLTAYTNDWSVAYRGPVFVSDGRGPPAEGDVDPSRDPPGRALTHGPVVLSDAALEHASIVAAAGARPFGMTQQQIDAEIARRKMANALAKACADGWAEGMTEGAMP